MCLNLLLPFRSYLAGSFIVLTGLALLVATTSQPVAAQKNNGSFDVERHFQAQLKLLERVRPVSPCVKSALIALKDKTVRHIFINKAKNECYVLKDVCCLQIPSIPGYEYVLFNFDCAPNCFCIVDPQFLVVVDHVNGKIIDIKDPYLGPTRPCLSIRKVERGMDDGPTAKKKPGRLPIIGGFPDRIRARVEIRNRRLRQLVPKSVFEIANLWPQGREITVAFRGGNESAYKEILAQANEWAQLGNFSIRGTDSSGKFLKWSSTDTSYAADIRVAFLEDDGYWSLLGTDSRNSFIVPAGEPSMNLEGMGDGNLSANERGTVIHEFGHALGFHHEHQNPDGGCDSEFRWDDEPGYVKTTDILGQFVADSNGKRPGIYTVLGGPPNKWSKATVDFNLRQLPDSNAFSTSPHDPQSIMHYSFPEWMFVNGAASPCFTTRNNALSLLDIAGVRDAYPTSKNQKQFMKMRDVNHSLAKVKNIRTLIWMPGKGKK